MVVLARLVAVCRLCFSSDMYLHLGRFDLLANVLLVWSFEMQGAW